MFSQIVVHILICGIFFCVTIVPCNLAIILVIIASYLFTVSHFKLHKSTFLWWFSNFLALRSLLIIFYEILSTFCLVLTTFIRVIHEQTLHPFDRHGFIPATPIDTKFQISFWHKIYNSTSSIIEALTLVSANCFCHFVQHLNTLYQHNC